ncbi:MAG TPA: ribonuclease [Burkholderiaceae bacterium]|jgi:ribonuclease T1
MLAGRFIKQCLVFLLTLALSFSVVAKGTSLPTIAFTDLPKEAQKTVILIKQGGPYPYPKDGVVFGNYERVLPSHKRGYYHEFTVKTPGTHNRGARRIIVGGALAQPSDFYYTDDHYASFKRITE